MNRSDEPETATAFDLAVVLADTELLSAHRYSEWAMLGAPGLEENIALSAIIQDELGHARTMYKNLATIGDVSLEEMFYERCPGAWRSPVVLDEKLGGWAEIICSLAFLDLATVLVYENVEAGSHEVLSATAGKVLQEETQHFHHGQGWIPVFADPDETEFSSTTFQSAVNRMVPEIATWLGRDQGNQELVETGVLERPNSAMREEFIEEAESLLTAAGFEFPDVEPDWSSWNDATRRPYPPDGDSFALAVEAATTRDYRAIAQS